MKRRIPTFDAAGEAVLASVIAITLASIVILQLVRRSPAFLLGLPFAWAFGEWAVRSWKEAINTDNMFHPIAGEKAPSGESPVIISKKCNSCREA